MVNPDTKERVRVQLGRITEAEAVARRDAILDGTGNIIRPTGVPGEIHFAELVDPLLALPEIHGAGAHDAVR